MMRRWSRYAMVAGALALSACAAGVDRLLEEAQFHLDRAEFTEAAAKAEEALVKSPDDNRVKFVLASAWIGEGFLGDEGSYLEQLARVQEDRGPDESNMETFVRIAPGLAGDGLEKIRGARDLLAGIPDGYKEAHREVYLQLYMVRLFEISAAVSQIGGNSEDVLCNADGSSFPAGDGVPDDLDPAAFDDDATSRTRFRENLAELPLDGAAAGLGSDFTVTERFVEMADSLDAFIEASGDEAPGFEAFFEDEFGVNDATCLTAG